MFSKVCAKHLSTKIFSASSKHEMVQTIAERALSMFSIMMLFTCLTWAFTLDSLLTSSGWSVQYCIWSLSLNLYCQSPSMPTVRNKKKSSVQYWKCIWKPEKKFLFLQTKNENCYPKSRVRLLVVAIAALPPAYLLLKSSLIIPRKTIGICRPADSIATTQYAAIWFQLLTQVELSKHK